MKNTSVLLVSFIVLIVAAAAAAFLDYRSPGFKHNPDNFTIIETAAFSNSITSYSKGHNILWSASGIVDFTVDEQGLTSVLKDDIVYLPGGACGGLVVPHDTEEIFTTGDYMIATTPDARYLFYTPDCASYNRIPRRGNQVHSDGKLICEAVPNEYIIRNIYGDIIFRNGTDSQITAAYADSGKCYFMDSEGTLTGIGSDFVPQIYLETGSEVLSAQATPRGINIMSADEYVNIDIDGNSIMAEYIKISDSGRCMPAKNSTALFCENENEKNLAEKAFMAGEIAVTAEAYYIYDGDRLAAYEVEQDWVKTLATSFELPYGCNTADYLYFSDTSALVWEYGLENQSLAQVRDFPDSCLFAPYRDGSFYSYIENELLYNYAEVVTQEGGKTLYKRDANGSVYYFTISN